MTVAQELENRRRCRFKLAGVLVAVDGRGEPVPVESTAWDRDSRLLVTLADGRKLHAERLHLRSFWPIACCRPDVKNVFNGRSRRRPGGA